MGMNYDPQFGPNENPNWEHQYDEKLNSMELQRQAEEANRLRHEHRYMRWVKLLIRFFRQRKSS